MGVLKIEPGVSGYMNLTSTERDTIQHVERSGASLSLVGVSLIFVAYALSKRLRTVPNTFILFASIANVGASVACLVGYDGIMAGDPSALCQMQAFLLEMFMQSDPWWSLAMAVNVFLVFFFAANPNSFRNYLWLYSLVCFGLPAVPAFVMLFYAPNGKKIYGNATLWCWIDDDFNQLRIFLYYLPIWTCIVLSILVYVAVGYNVFHQRNQLRNLTLSNPGRDIVGSRDRNSAEKGQAGLPNSYGTVTTEVQVTAESSDSQTVTPPSTPTPSMTAVLQTPSSMRLHTWPSPLDDDDDDDDGDLGSGNRSAASRIPSPFGNTVSTSITSTIVPPARTTTTINGKPTTTTTTTTTSSDTTSAPKKTKPSVTFAKIRKPLHQLRIKFRNLDPVKLAYLRTSFIFAVSIIVTWTPSSINRVYSFVHPRSTSYVLNLASAVVLPLQGVWNASIFCFSSWSIIKEEVREWKKKHGISGGWSRSRSNSRRCGERLAGGDGNFIGGHRNGFVPMRYGNGFGGYRYGNGLDDAELIEATSPRRMSTMRVIRGGSL